jgi:hypothetical protein
MPLKLDFISQSNIPKAQLSLDLNDMGEADE